MAALHNLELISAAQVRDLGERLYATAFSGEVRQVLLSALHMLDAQAKTQPGTLLQIRLWLSETPELASLPWELLYLSEFGLHLALMPQVSLIRHLDVRRRSTLTEVTPPLHILCVIAAPSDQESLDAEIEWQRLQVDFAGLSADGLVQVERLPQATFAALAARLDAESVHILHFIGHGVFDPYSGNGAIAFEDATGTTQLVSGEQLVQVLGAHASLRLVVLNACEGAQSDGEDAHVGVAQRLVVGGLPAVVAMQFLITDGAARVFAQEFYESLGRGRVVDVAMQRARQAIYAQPNPVEWATPVLFEAKGEPLRIAPPPTPDQPPKRWWQLAALTVLLVLVIAMVIALFTNTRLRCAVGLATCDIPDTVAATTPAPPTELPTLAAATVAITALPTIVGRPPITVGFATLLDCTDPNLGETIQAGIKDELRNVDLLDTRVFIEAIDAVVADEIGARRYKGRYDIVAWGGCAPATDNTVTERVTVTATLIMVGDSPDEAVNHRVAQPDAVALTLPSNEISMISDGAASILAYFGESEITNSHQLLADFSKEAAPYLSVEKHQKSTIYWLIGNAFLEHPDLVLRHFPIPPLINTELRNLTLSAYDQALGTVESYAQPQIEAAIRQNQGWLFMRISETERASEQFLAALNINPNLVGATEGYVYAKDALGANYAEIRQLCEKLLELGGGAQATYCLARNEWLKGDRQKSADWASYAVQQRPKYAPNYLLLAQNACEMRHQESETIQWYDGFLDAYRKMARWDTVGFEARVELVTDELKEFEQEGNSCAEQ